MRFLRFAGSILCILSIGMLCLLAASVFNPVISEKMKKAGGEVISAIREFSEKAEINAFSEDLR